jgi:hypothetical protein
MILASVCPCSVGYCGLVIASGERAPFQVIRAVSVAVGRLVESPNKAGTDRPLERVLTVADAEALASMVLFECINEKASVLYLEDSTLAIGHELAIKIDALARVLGVSCVTSEAPQVMHRDRSRAAKDVVRASFVGWPVPSYTSIEYAGEALVARTGGMPAAALAVQAEIVRAPTTYTRTESIVDAPGVAEIGDSFRGPCCAAIDPGSAWIGIAVKDVNGRCVHHSTVEVGREVMLAKPKTVRRKDGSSYVRTKKRVMTPEDVDDAIAAVDTVLRRFSVNRVIIEWVECARLPLDKPAMCAMVATDLVRSQWVAGELRRWCKSMALVDVDIEVECVLNRTWLGAIGGGKHGAYAAAIEARFPEMRGANEHERDAAGILMWDEMPDAVAEAKAAVPSPGQAKGMAAAGVARKRKEHTPEEKAKRAEAASKAREREKEKHREERRAAGCACTSKRHRRECPLFVSRAGLAAAKYARGGASECN